MSDKVQDPVNRSDSGLGSLSSESDTSPSQCPTKENEMSKSLCDPELHNDDKNSRDSDTANHAKVKTHKKYIVSYCGSVEIDKRYTQPQFWKVILQWLVAEIKKTSTKIVVFLEIQNGLLKGICCERDGLLFQHDLFHLSKFSRTHQDTRCFAYLTKATETTFNCHVFQTADESLVLSIFTSIKETTKSNNKENASNSSPVSKHTFHAEGVSTDSNYVFPSSLFEVLYIGKIIVSNKKAPPTFIDDAVDRFQQYEEKKDEEERQRHGSGVSVKSLPTNLEKTVSLMENELAKQLQGAVTSHSNESNLSTDSGSDHSDSVLYGTSMSHTNLDHRADMDTTEAKQTSDISGSEESVGDTTDGTLGKGSSSGENLQRTTLVSQHQAHSKKNRTMLLQIGRNDVSLVSPDRKRSILKTNFRDISFCSQGIKHPEYFGFISRDVSSSSFYCYVFRCATEAVVEEVMQTLKMAFNAAFQHSAKTHMCELCPMHQLHKLAEEIDKQSYEKILEIVQKRIEQLNEKDQEEIALQFQDESCKTPQEKAELFMIVLRHMCEERQKHHTHISDPGKSLQSYEFTLTESAKNRHSKFDDLGKMVKRSLSESFESIKERVRHKSGEAMREIFKEKSGNSEDSPFKSGDDDGNLTPIASPTFKESTSQFPFTPSPIPEEGNPGVKEKEQKRTSILREMREQHEHRTQHGEREVCSDPEESQQPESPLKNMFLKANTTDESYNQAGQSRSLPTNVRQRTRRNSWRFNIFEKVVTPAKLTRSTSFIESSVTPEEEPIPSNLFPDTEAGDTDKEMRSKRYRMLWKKAFLETLLLIRMKKNIKSLQTRQDDLPEKHIRLEYEEMTPCLKQVTKVWDQMLNNPSRLLLKVEKTKISQAVKDGVPRNKRGAIWLFLIEQFKLQNSSLLKEIPQLSLRYEDLLKQLTTHQHAILIDLGRTFPSHPYFSTQLGAGQLGLFNILKAYSLLDKEVGYCQGVSFVAGVLLMHMDEEQAFDVIRYMMFVLGFRRQYKPDMVALQIQMYQLSRLLHDNYRDLYDHFELHEVAPTLYAAPWFLTMFASQFPLGFVARVFDLIFLQGMEVVLKVALVVLGNHKELIKQCASFEAIVDFLKTTLPGMGIIQMERVFNQVYSMDVSKQLNAYEVEYHVLQEEMITTPHRNDHDRVEKLDSANHNLKRQNLELLEQLQTAHSVNHSVEQQVHALQTSQAKLKSHIRTLELERAALLNTMSNIRKVVPKEQLEAAGIQIPVIPKDKTILNSPIHNPSVSGMLQSPVNRGGDGASVSDLDQEVAILMNKMGMETTTSPTPQHRIRPPQRKRRPSSSEN